MPNHQYRLQLYGGIDQRRIVLSLPAEANHFPSGLKVMLSVPLPCPHRLATSHPVFRSQIRMPPESASGILRPTPPNPPPEYPTKEI
jgi:hypothetical protein